MLAWFYMFYSWKIFSNADLRSMSCLFPLKLDCSNSQTVKDKVLQIPSIGNSGCGSIIHRDSSIVKRCICSVCVLLRILANQSIFSSVKILTCRCHAEKAFLASGLHKWVFPAALASRLVRTMWLRGGMVFEGFRWGLMLLAALSALCWCPLGTRVCVLYRGKWYQKYPWFYFTNWHSSGQKFPSR